MNAARGDWGCTGLSVSYDVWPQSQCFLRTYASILPTSLSVPFSMYQSILCLGTWCGDEYGLQKGFWLLFFFFFDPRTPQVFALMRITHNNDSMKVSCIFQSRAPSPNNAKSIEALAPTKVRGVDYGEKRAHRGRIDLSPGKLKCISTQFTNDYLLYNYLLFFCFCSPVQFLFGIWSQVLCCPISIVSRTLSPKGKRPEHLHFPNKTNCRCAQIPNNSCTSAVGTKSFPAPVSNIACSN